MQITKAIIPVAGWGTRRLPITKSIEKCMLPIGNRPLVDYVVRDCIKGGIKDIYFVVSKGSHQLQQYYSDNQDLNEFLKYNGKESMLELARPPRSVNFHYIEQDPNGKYGTAVPVSLVFPHLPKGESVAVMMGDDFIYNKDNSSEIARLMEVTPEGGSSMLMAEVPKDQVNRYGVLQLNKETGAYEQIVEKPDINQAPSNYINISKYILSYDMMTRIYNYCQIDASGEYMILEPMNQYALEGGVINTLPIKGTFLDGGNVHDWLHANEVVVRGQ